jgi:hypothetical protein
MADGFLGRWSRRKLDAQEGKPLDEPVPPVAVAPPVANAPAPLATSPAPLPPEPALPTLADAQALTPQSDFSTFVLRGVAPEVRNTAMKKLFADPHFNVMDGLDIYIDDYTQPSPMPAAMLRRMASAKFLGFAQDDDPPVASNAAPTASAATPLPQPTDSGPAAPSAHPELPANHNDHAHAHLRLQPDHAPEPPSPGQGAG